MKQRGQRQGKAAIKSDLSGGFSWKGKCQTFKFAAWKWRPLLWYTYSNLFDLMSYCMRLNVHILAQQIKLSLSVLIDSLHLSTDFPTWNSRIDKVWANSIITSTHWGLLLCLHLSESVLQRTLNAVHYLNFKIKSSVCREFPDVCKHRWVLICYCRIVELVQTLRNCQYFRSNYINVKVWL